MNHTSAQALAPSPADQLAARLDKLEGGVRLAHQHIKRLARAGLPADQLALVEGELARWEQLG